MDRFRTLPGVIFNNDRTPLKRAEEMAIVIGLAATRLRQTLDREEENLFTNVRRTGIAIAAGVLLLAVLGSWWLLQNGQSSTIPTVIVGTFVALALIALALVFAPYSKRFRVTGEQAAVTRISRLYWPVGILPLGSERALLWDALTDKNETISIIDLPPTAGMEQERVAESASKPDTILGALLSYQTELEKIAHETTAWPANLPDASLERLGAEAGDLWKRMNLLMSEDPNAVVGFHAPSGAEAWRTVADEGERIHTFFQEIESLRLLTERYTHRAQLMVDRARELTVEHGFAMMQAVEDGRATHFASPNATDDETLALVPGAPVNVSASTTADQIRAGIARLRGALKPLDEQIMAEIGHLSQAEAAELRDIDNGHQSEKEEIRLIEQSIAKTDSDILALAQTLETYRARIEESRERILNGYAQIRETPVQQLRDTAHELERAVASATETLGEATPKMNLPGLERTMTALTEALSKAHDSWTKLSTDLPERGQDVQARLENIQDALKSVSEGHLALSPSDVNDMLKSVKNVERVTRDMVSWTTRQQDPISPIEDHDHDLKSHIAALADLRRRLEEANGTFASATSRTSEEADSAPLSRFLARAEKQVNEFTHLTNETASAAAALNNAAETVQKQSAQIEQLLRQRDDLRAQFETRSADLLKMVQQEREQVGANHAQRKAEIAALRARLDELPQAVEARLEATLTNPALANSGVLKDKNAVPWSEVVVNQMALAVDEWGKRVAGIDGIEEVPLIQQIREMLETSYTDIVERSVTARLAPDEHPLSPHICFVPFWYVETDSQPDVESVKGRMVHIFPPLHLDRPAPTEMPGIESLRYREVSRRLLGYIRRDYLNGGDPVDSLSFDPVVLTDLARAIPEEVGAPLWQEVATALAQHWVFFRSDDVLLNRIVLNSRDHLLPAGQIVEAWLNNAKQNALTDEPQ